MASDWFSLDQLREETPEERAAEEIRLRHEAQAREAREQKASVEMANRQSMGMGGGFGGMMTDAMAPAT